MPEMKQLESHNIGIKNWGRMMPALLRHLLEVSSCQLQLQLKSLLGPYPTIFIATIFRMFCSRVLLPIHMGKSFNSLRKRNTLY